MNKSHSFLGFCISVFVRWRRSKAPLGILLRLVIIGGGLAGLGTAFILQDELEPSEMLLLEKERYDPKSSSLSTASLGSSFEKTLRSLGIDASEGVTFYDAIQIHNWDGKVLLEYDIPIAIADVSFLRWEFSRLIRKEYIREHTEVTRIQRKSNERNIEILTSGKTSEVYKASSIIDSSGFDWFLTKEAIETERYEFFRHNDYVFYQALLESTRVPIDKETIHIIFNEFAVPGGFAILFNPERDKVLISGYYNVSLTSRTPRESANVVKNSLGIVGRLVGIYSRRIPLGRPLLLISPYESMFLIGASNLGVYPTIFSGVIYNNSTTEKLTRTILKLMDSGIPSEDVSLRINAYHVRSIFPQSEALDILRAALLLLRSAELEDISARIFEIFSKLLSSELIISNKYMVEILMNLLSDSRVLKKIIALLKVAYDLLKLSENIPTDSMNSQTEFAKFFSSQYSQKMNGLLPQSLVEKVRF